jgi:hypothetical protein
MKTILIDENVHKRLKIKIAEGCQYKTIREFINSIVVIGLDLLDKEKEEKDGK